MTGIKIALFTVMLLIAMLGWQVSVEIDRVHNTKPIAKDTVLQPVVLPSKVSMYWQKGDTIFAVFDSLTNNDTVYGSSKVDTLKVTRSHGQAMAFNIHFIK
jgi:hypothetical protein